MSTISKEIFDSRDTVVIESNIDVYESLCASYDKAYDILEYCSEDESDLSLFNIVQEAAIEEDDTDVDAEAKKSKKKKSKKDNEDSLIKKMIDAVISFFKMIGSAIASFFGKVKEGVTDKLRKLSKKSDSECDRVQKEIDNGPAGKKIDNAASKFEEKIDMKEEYTESGSESSSDDDKGEKKGDNKTKIIVKDKKVKTHIKLDNWITFLKYSLAYSERIVDTTEGLTKSDVNSAITNRPTRALQNKLIPSPKGSNHRVDAEYDKVQGKIADIAGDIKGGSDVRKARLKRTILFTRICRRYRMSEMADKLDTINDLLQKNIDSSKAALEKFKKIKIMVDKGTSNPRLKKLIRNINKIHVELGNIGRVTLALTKYIGLELGLYDAMLNIIIPMFDKEKADKEKEEEKSNPTVNVNVRTKKDDEEEKE